MKELLLNLYSAGQLYLNAVTTTVQLTLNQL